ncbi:hypothetical protein [Acinetobacter sp.]|uniref:hypothetical protein n=1 Tax=Acinetobacter sp. TaxID=472 RepID=UPI003B006E76
MDKCKPYTQAELDQQAIWADEFDQWWESEGQYHRAGGDDYCRTFAWWAWLSREQSRQAELDQAYEDIETFAQAYQRECDIKVQIANELKEKDKRIEEVLFVIARAKDGYYGYSNDGGDTDNLVFDFEKALGGNNANS